jgi:TolB-like protein
MADIFISYSSKDRQQAEQLTELLSSAGLSVWIDKSGIDVATSWSAEITKAISDCKAFIVLLSLSSVASANVSKEISLASERKKKILPLDLEPVELPDDIAYHLAGLQRAPMTNIDSIIRAIGKLGLESIKPSDMKLIKQTDSRKSLVILPFEDLSPTGDNGWFADGLSSELIAVLSTIQSLRLLDWNTSKLLRESKSSTTSLAKAFSVRYFIEGQVRKFGDDIKISVTLLDVETGDHLWYQSFKGTISDIFDIQETVALKVADGLSVILTKEEEQRIEKRLTTNAEAYELWLKGRDYYAKYTNKDQEFALSLFEEAVRLDANFARAYAGIASVYRERYAYFDKSPVWIEQAQEAAEKVKAIEGETPLYFWTKSTIAGMAGDHEAALLFAKKVVAADPKDASAYDALSMAYANAGLTQQAVDACVAFVSLRENDTRAHWNLLVILNRAGYMDRLLIAAQRAIPFFERNIKLNPDNYNERMHYASVLYWSGKTREAIVLADELSETAPAGVLFCIKLAVFYATAGRIDQAIVQLRRVVDIGFTNIGEFRTDIDFSLLRTTPQFAAFMEEMEAKFPAKKNG